MIVILVPFFLAAQLREPGWPQGAAEATYRFSVNSTAVSASTHQHYEHDRSTRFNMQAKLRCRFRGPASLICRLTDTQAFSFASKTMDPMVPGVPIEDTLMEHAEYQIAEEAFEIIFTPNGIGKIQVNRTVSPHDLNIIRAVINQFNVGCNLAKRRDNEFRHMERSLIGKCDTLYTVQNATANTFRETTPAPAASSNNLRRGPNFGECNGCKQQQQDSLKATSTTTTRRSSKEQQQRQQPEGYKLNGLESLGRKRGEAMRLEKWRNVHKCTLRADYFFGSREGFRSDPADFEARIVASESSVYVSDTNFVSYTFNELLISRQRGDDLTIYENYSLSLASIEPAETKYPMSIVNPASASVYAYQFIDDEDDVDAGKSVEAYKRVRTTRPPNPTTSTTGAPATTTTCRPKTKKL